MQAAVAEFKAMYRHQWAMSHCREKAEHLLLSTQHAHSDSSEALAAQYRAHCERRAAYTHSAAAPRRLTNPAVALVQAAGRKYPQAPHGRDARRATRVRVAEQFVLLDAWTGNIRLTPIPLPKAASSGGGALAGFPPADLRPTVYLPNVPTWRPVYLSVIAVGVHPL
jgi:hypothetical protein